jgi:hypothetical protein
LKQNSLPFYSDCKTRDGGAHMRTFSFFQIKKTHLQKANKDT